MFDIDIMAAEWLKLEPIEGTKEEATYIRYKVLKYDNTENRFNIDRIKHIAIFELKYKKTDSVIQKAHMNPGEPMWAAYMTAKLLKCRFFLVIASDGKSPFYFYERCIETGKWLEKRVLFFDYQIDNPELIKNFFNNELNINE